MAKSLKPLSSLRERLAHVRDRVDTAARQCNRSPDEITLIAISKTHPAQTLRAAISLGMTELGENRVQEAEEKILELGRQSARWHLVGHLQANKARRAVNLFDVIHSLDSVALAQRLDRLCAAEGREELPVLIQIDLGGEESKTGIDPRELPRLLEATAACERLRLIGLMTLPPYFENAERGRPFFKTLRELRDQLQAQGSFGQRSGELSMGMSHDFEIAIEERATMLRVGTAIFGKRL
ncbi:MAG: YggS family pyridoxal phosphate-dependent enzyme [Acidobacteriota bacterium]|nr:YggS family pyridoxal phosphate-dependent enzyme [Acidobacteriota bacterium]